MHENAELLGHIYKNSQIGFHAMELLKEKINDPHFLTHCNTQLQKYGEIHKRATEILHDSGYEESSLRQMAQPSVSSEILLKTLHSGNPANAAEILMQGSTLGMIETTKSIRKCRDASPEILHLATQLLQTEETGAEQSKSFL